MKQKYKTKSLIIFDWDDTLFPTTWVVKNGILAKNKSNLFSAYFQYLDTVVYNLISKIKKSCKIVIVTNASEKWVHKCITIMPKTKDILNNINIYSSREMFQKKYPTENYMWKKLFFKHVIDKIYSNRNYSKNIISVGDAEYEYFALIGLYLDSKNNIDRIKTVKLTRFPTKEDLIKEIKLLEQFMPSLILSTQHNYDLHVTL